MTDMPYKRKKQMKPYFAPDTIRFAAAKLHSRLVLMERLPPGELNNKDFAFVLKEYVRYCDMMPKSQREKLSGVRHYEPKTVGEEVSGRSAKAPVRPDFS